ncbi:MAG: CvpA family protein [Alphaproteobacteria bacterium]|nr:CvpA family protein [Alphaproteobacteria bacterium]
MTESQPFFNLLDYTYIFIMLASTLFGLANGFTRTLLSLFAWVGSAFISTEFSPYVYEFLKDNFQEPMAGKVIASSSTYVISLIILMVISFLVADFVKNSILSSLDRSLGLLFGLVRGICIPVGLISILLLLNVPKDKFFIVENSKISCLIYDSLSSFTPYINVSNLNIRKMLNIEEKENIQNAVLKQFYEQKLNPKKTGQEMSKAKNESAKNTAKISNFKINSPQHNSLGLKVTSHKRNSKKYNTKK